MSEIPTDVICVALCEIIEKRLKSNDYNITVSSAATPGESNFVGIVHRVSCSKNVEDNHDSLILKVAPQNNARRMQFSSRLVFLREIFMYNEVIE